MRADCGTENSIVSFLQPYLCHDVNSFKYGASVSNQVYMYGQCCLVITHAEDRGILEFSETVVHRLVDKPFSGNRNASYCSNCKHWNYFQGLLMEGLFEDANIIHKYA